MSLFKIFDVAGSAMSAQSLRLNTTASNLANVDSVARSAEEAYKARQPVFRALVMDQQGEAAVGVEMLDVVHSGATHPIRHAPGHPLADEDGNVHLANVNAVEEMVNMISASRSYQSNVEVLNTSKQLLLRTLRLGE
jgi:flagellar basal-body rod protein FlgC